MWVTFDDVNFVAVVKRLFFVEPGHLYVVTTKCLIPLQFLLAVYKEKHTL